MTKKKTKRTKRKTSTKRRPKLSRRVQELASIFIAEEMRSGQYPRAQAIAIGISRARAFDKEMQRRCGPPRRG